MSISVYEFDRIRQLAIAAHGEQRYGELPYEAHLVDVALRVMHAGGTHEQIVAALLHDVLEDTAETPVSLYSKGVGAAAIRIILMLTRLKGQESYATFIERLKDDDEARLIKLCDLASNMSACVANPTEKNQSLFKRYMQEWEVLHG